MGLSISYIPGSAVTVSGGKGKTNTDSAYESVTEQAGIYAGKEGYDIQVKNTAILKGAVIDSQAEKEKNRITTGTLTWENIDNKAEYKASGKGISYTNGAGIPLNALGLLSNMGPTVKDKAGTTTTSTVSKEIITITDKENQKQDIEKLNRNTEDSLNKLKEIFDKTKVEERKRLLEELGIVGNRAIHEMASHNGWKDGSAEKVALHGMLGAITGAKSGGSALSGLIAGGANEYAIGYLEKSKGKDWINKHPDTVQNISAAFGGILSKMTGGSGHTGAYISQMGTKWNLFGMEVTEEEQAQTEEILNSMGMKIGEIMTGNDREYIKEKFSESALNGAIALAEWTEKYYSEIMVDEISKGELRLEGLKFLGKLSAWINLAAILKFNVDVQYEKYEELNIKFEEKGKSYWVDVYNRLKENTSDAMD